jgi:hypothetical protein
MVEMVDHAAFGMSGAFTGRTPCYKTNGNRAQSS